MNKLQIVRIQVFKYLGWNSYKCMRQPVTLMFIISSSLFLVTGAVVWYAARFKTQNSMILAIILIVLSIISIILCASLTDVLDMELDR